MAGEVTKARLDGLKAGINDLLVKVNALLAAEAYAESLPIIGTRLANATPALETLTKLSTALQTAVNVVSGLQNLSTMTTAQVAQALTDALAPQINDLKSAANKFLGNVGATVDASGNIVLTVDMGRTIDVGFTLGDLGMSGLGLDLAGQGNAQLAYNLDFRIGADATGFWFDPAGSNLSIGTKVDLNGLSASGNLGILHFAVSNIEDGDPASDADTLRFDISSTWNGSGLIRSFATDLIDFRASGDVDLDLKLQGDLSNAALPSISADFHVDWNFSQSLLNGGGANSWSPATVGFTNVRYDFGNFVETTIRPVVEKLAPILGPINEALKILNTDFTGAIPEAWRDTLNVNGDQKITLLDFIQGAAALAGRPIDTAPIQGLIDTVKQIVDLANLLSGKNFSNDPYLIGDYSTQFSQVQGAVDALSKIDLSSAGSFIDKAPSLAGFLTGLAASNPGGFGASSGGANAGTQLSNLVSNTRLSFPMIENPLSVVKLLIGQDADIFKFNMPAINLALGMDANGNITNPLTAFVFPIWPLPYIDVRVNLALQMVADLAFGYDTSGLRYWMSQGSNVANIADVFTHGFYLNDQRSGGTDIAEFVFRAAVELAVTSSVGAVTIGGGANVTGEIALDIANALTNADGKLYLSQIPSVALTNPFALFDVSGSVEAGARFWVDWPFGNIFNVSTPGVELLSFEERQDATALGLSAYNNAAATPPPPPGLADVISSGLWLAVGPRAGERDIANKLDTGEQLRISGSGNSLIVSGFGVSQTFATGNVASIQADGANGNDTITIAAGVTTPARMSGGEGNDFLQGGDGEDRLYGGVLDDYLVGGAGADTLEGEDGNDRLEGGAGGDTLRGGAGLDTATYATSGGVTLNLTTPSLSTGDAVDDTFESIEIFEGSNAADTMIGSAGADIFTALDGNDTLQGMGGDDTLAPGRGTNSVDGGDGFDIVNYYNIPAGVTVVGQAGGGYRVTAGAIVDDTLINVEQIDGSANADTMTGGAANDIFVGREGDDTLDGGAGDDTLVGGEGRDTLRGGDGDKDRASYILSATGLTVSLLNPNQNTGEAIGDSYAGIEGLRGSEHDDTLSGDGDANLLQGGAGKDTLNGNDGDDTLQGGTGGDALNGGGGRDIASYYGSTGKVTLDLQNRSRDEGEAVDDSFSSIEVYQGTRFSDSITGSDTAEELWGEEGNDRLSGMGGGDTLIGGGGDDTLDGGAGEDTLDGGANDDTVYGGIGNDVITGGDGIDRLYGGGDDDTVSGGAGDDFVYGDAGSDTLSGGAGDDTIDGGTGRDRVSYDDTAPNGVRLNLSSGTRLLGGATVAAFSAIDTSGGVDSFAATGALAHVEDATGSARTDWIVANEGGSTIEGLGGNDTLTGLAGTDTLRGGDGDDTIDAGDGADTVMGGAGTNDLKGGGGTDWLSFTDIAGSVAASLATNVATKSAGGTDTLAGFENLRGSGGGDTLTGDASDNVIEGLAGNDVIDGGGGVDTLYGGDGDDILYRDSYGAGGDVAVGGAGNDLIRTSADVPLNTGAGGEDVELIGGAKIARGDSDANRLMGNALDNLLDGQDGDDTLWGYAGDDTYVFDTLGDRLGTASYYRGLTAGAAEVAGGGTDTILLATANVWGGTAQNKTVYTYSLQREDLTQVENLVLTDNARQVNLTGNALGNRLVGNDFSQVIRGEDGDDVMVTGVGDDDTFGGAGRDTIEVDWSRATYGVEMRVPTTVNTALGGYDGDFQSYYQGWYASFVSVERFVITTGSGNDSIVTKDADDIVKLGSGDDFVDIGSGRDEGDGGTGDDGITADYATDATAILWDLRANTYSGGGRSFANFEYFGSLKTGSGNDVIVTDRIGRSETIDTGAGDDRVTVISGHDTITAGAGFDTLVVDWSAAAYGIETVTAPTGAAATGYGGRFFSYYASRNVEYTGIERFEITGGSASDTIVTGDNDDIVKLGAGDDFVDVRSGRDEADGGTGDDGVTANYAADTAAIRWDLQANSYSGSGRSFTNFEYFGTLKTGSGNDVIVTDKLGKAEVIETGAGDDRITLFTGYDTVKAGTGFDTLVIDWSQAAYGIETTVNPTGTATGGYDGRFFSYYSSRNVEYTGVERFEITGGSASDTIVVGDNDDIVKLGAGDDFVDLKAGRDEADGGTGDDGVSANYATDTAAVLWDLQANSYAGSGRIITNFEYFGTLKTGSGNDVIVTDKLGKAEVIETGAGDDRVTVFSGYDTVKAGDGFDTLVVDWSLATYGMEATVSPTGTAAGGYSGRYFSYYSGRNVEYTGVERFEITGGSASDTVVTGNNDDIVKLGAGDDFADVGAGRDEADGGIGNDGISASYATDTTAIVWNLQTNSYSGGGRSFTGFEYFGTLKTGSGDDVIVTDKLGKSEVIETGAGDDRVTVFSGGDTVRAGTGSDTLVIDWSWATYGVETNTTPTGTASASYDGRFSSYYSGVGVDYTGVERFEITTGSAGDTITTGDNADIVMLGAGDDFVNVKAGADRADGGIGSDGISADLSGETLAISWNLTANTYAEGADGTAGDTRAFTNFEYFGTLRTGSGDDTIVTTTETRSEVIHSGGGDDRVTFRGGDDDLFAGSGNDTLVVDWARATNDVQMRIATTANTVLGGFNGDFQSYYHGWYASFDSVERFEISTGSGNDAIVTMTGDDIVRLGAGDDFVDIGSGRDEADGGTGNDGISADYSTDTTAIAWNIQTNAYSGAGRIFTNFEYFGTLKTGGGDDVIVTDRIGKAETIETGAGDDRVTLYSGTDIVRAGAGTDTLVIDWSASAHGVETNGVAGANTALGGFNGAFQAYYQGWSVTYTSVEKFDITTGNSSDSIVTAAGDDIVRTGGGNDYIETRGGNDTLDGGAGSDTMVGGAGDDVYHVDATGDVVTELANEGIDEVRTALATYSLAALANVEKLTGTSTLGGQTLTGNAADNVILGGAYGDILDGGAGSDTLRGGTGDDFFVAGKGSNDQYFGDAGTDTVVIDGTLANWDFVLLGDGRVQMTDKRDAANSVAFLTGIERVEIKGVGSWDLGSVVAGTSGAATPGTTGNDVVTTVAGGLTLLTQGGTDKAIGTAGTDSVLFGASFDPTDEYDGGTGLDEIGLQGNYKVTFGAGVVNVEALTLLSAGDTRFGAPGTGTFSYDLTFNDANVAAGSTFVIQANSLLPGENLTFDGRAETNGSFLLYAGKGNDTVTGGKGVDGFYFGNGRFDAFDTVDGFEGPDDQLGIRGDYSTLVELGPNTIRNIGTFVLISSSDARFGSTAVTSSFNIKLHDANLAAGKTMTIQGNSLTAAEVARFDGSNETDGNFLFIGGAGNDVFIGGAGADRFYGAAGADTMTGGGGNDVFLYLRAANSTPTSQDTIADFRTGDRIDLSQFDAIPGGSRDAFTFVSDFTGAAGQLRVRQDSTNPAIWFVEGDTDGIGGADFSIKVVSDHAITVADFIL